MNQTLEDQIGDAESQLREAMLKSDVHVLDRLLAPDLIFTNFLGHLQSKEDDISAYRSGALKIRDIQSSERHVRLVGGVAIVSVRVKLSGTCAGDPADGDFRFTRIWALSCDSVWQVAAAHASRVA